ncbi:sodium/hydrogen exchanger 6 [Tanacetum coccineum]|uniref:Sodium/hydrogen exchanger 6 n=1 Tax=Tanacetum coccineum TaxID=301880 RepID=A0ABQ4Z3A0_9ASTR
MAFPIIEYYVNNNWAKYGLKRIMINAKGFFFFKFDSRASLDAILEGGPWMVRNSPIILKKWTMNTSLQEEELTRILIWVKLHDVPIQVFEEDGISLIAMYLGIPNLEGPGHTKDTIRVEYEWKPPKCPTCNIFGHTGKTCPKKVVTTLVVNDTNVTNDGFQKVVNRKRNNKGSYAGNKLPNGVPVIGPSKNMNDDASLITKGTNTRQQDTGKKKISNIASPNPFAALGVDDDEEEEVENIWDESKNLNLRNTEASTPAQMSHVDVAVVYYTCKKVNTCADHKTLFCSFVYADNYYIDRHVLWSNLVGHAGLMRNRPSVLLGDFNTAFNLEDHSAGGYEPNAAMREFKDCVQAMEVGDVNSTGLYFRWNQKPKVSNGILKKIDRIMGNLQFNDAFLGSFAIFQPYRILDHLPCVLEAFREILETGWSVNLEGCAMFHVVKRLKGLKSPFHKLLHNYGNLHERVNKIRIELDEAQKAIDRDPSSFILHEEHAHYLLAFKAAQLDEERFLKQKANIEWLKAGDSNTTYFHKIVKSKCTRNRIEMVSDASNNLYDGNQVPGAFVNHYNQFLGAKGVTILLDDHNQVRDVSNDEVKSFIFSIEDDRAPGPDGFTAAFFKKAWDVVGGDITCVVRDFFSNGKLLKELNHTIISLIPKVTTPTCINDYRPISCCNVLYKCISKIIANGVKEDLTDIVSINQSAFVLGRRISNNIFLTQELIRNYHRRRGPPRCAFKVDIQKAYDTVDWSFLETILVGKRGLRQGDPLSPCLFTLVMEILTLILQRRVSGLVPSIPKSTAFFCNVSNAIKASILNFMPFAEGVLPASVFILPNRIVHDLEQLMLGFLWCQWETKKGKTKVVWDSVCMPNHEGGLGIRRIDDFNVALMATNIWSILTHRESLWVKWVHTYKLKGRSFWDVPCRGDVSWGCLVSSLYPSSCYTYVVGFSAEVKDTRQAAIVGCLSGCGLRNGRLFKKKTSSPDQIVDVIISMVRLNLVTFKFKKMSTRSRLLLDQWKIPNYCIVHDGSFSLPPLKELCPMAPGPDGFTAAFFKKPWDVVGGDITCAVRDFFSNGKLLKELNHTIISLIPKIIDNRVKESLGDIVSISLPLFLVVGFLIIFTQELMRNYHRRRGPPRCAFKVDIKKAHDTVDWSFLDTILVGFGFHPKMVYWIMVCISGASYSICVNGNLHGWFKGKRGLRQGDPLSPYLFTLVMEILSLILQRRLSDSDDFHSIAIIMDALEEFKQVSGLVPRIRKSTTFFCNVPNAIKASILNYMPFAEGVLPVRYLGAPLISSRLLYRDCKILVEKLESRVNDWRNKFLSLAGRLQLIRIVDFNVALMATHIWSILTRRKSLAHRVSSRDIVRSGLTLQSKVSDIVVNGTWSWPVDMLSKYPFLSNYNTPINDDVDRLVWSDSHGNIKKFSVTQVWSDIRSRDTKVNWYSMVWFPSCIPRHAINLWLIIRRKLKTQDLIPSWDVSNNLGSVCSLCESIPDSHDHIFFECIFARSVWNRLKGLAGLDSSNCNIYAIIQDLLPYVKSRTTRCVIAKLVVAASAYYVWQERNWRLFQKGKRSIDQVVECIKSVVRLKLLSCKLKKSKSGESLAKLWDLPEAVFINNGKSTSAWFDRWADLCPLKDMFSNKDIARFPIMVQLQVPLLLDDIDDVIFFWVKGKTAPQKLKTQERLWQWDIGPSIDLNLLRCPLCDLIPDSHDHLFFECAFSSHVWSKVRVLCGIDSIPPRLIDVTTFINPISKGKTALSWQTAVSILSRLVLDATSYYIWLERNERLFKKKTSSPDQIVDVIISMVRLKLVTFKFKKMSTRSRLLLDQWKIPSSCIVHDESSRRQTHLDRICSCCVAAGLWDVRLILCSHLGSCLA